MNKQIFYNIFFIFFVNANCFDIQPKSNEVIFNYNASDPLRLREELIEKYVNMPHGQKKLKCHLDVWPDTIERKKVNVQYVTPQLSSADNHNNPIPILIIGTPDTFGLIFHCIINEHQKTKEPIAAIKKEECTALINAYNKQKNPLFTINNQTDTYIIAHIIQEDCSGTKLQSIQKIPDKVIQYLYDLKKNKYEIFEYNIKSPPSFKEKSTIKKVKSEKNSNDGIVLEKGHIKKPLGRIVMHTDDRRLEFINTYYVTPILMDDNYTYENLAPIVIMKKEKNHYAILFKKEQEKYYRPFAVIENTFFEKLKNLLPTETPVFSINNELYFLLDIISSLSTKVENSDIRRMNTKDGRKRAAQNQVNNLSTGEESEPSGYLIRKRNDVKDPFVIPNITQLIYNLLYDNNAHQDLDSLSLVNKYFNTQITQYLTKNPYTPTFKIFRYDDRNNLRFESNPRWGGASLEYLCRKEAEAQYIKKIIFKSTNYSINDIVPVVVVGSTESHAFLFKYEENKALEPFAAITSEMFNALSNKYKNNVFTIIFANQQETQSSFYIAEIINQNFIQQSYYDRYCYYSLNLKKILENIKAPQNQDQPTNHSTKEHKIIEGATQKAKEAKQKILIRIMLECIMALSVCSLMFSIFMLLYINF